VDIIPNSLKAGVIIGAGIEALMGELKVGGLRLTLPLQNVMRWGESRWNLFIAVVVLVGLVALFILPLVTLFKPVLPIALSLTLILTAYICIMVGMEQLKTLLNEVWRASLRLCLLCQILNLLFSRLLLDCCCIF